MGTIYRRKDSPFLWIAFSRPGPDGRAQRFQQSSGYRPGQELLAERLVREIEDRIKAGFDAGVTSTELTVEEYGRRWHGARVRAEKWMNARLDDQAFVNHLYSAELHLIGRTVKFGGLKLGQVDHQHVIAWLEGLELKGLAGRTRASLLSLLNRMFKRAVREKRTLRNPCDGLERAETPKQADADPLWRQGARFTAPELAQLLTDPRVPMDRRVFYAIGFLGGLREGEIAALRWRSYDTRRSPLGCFSVGASFTRKNRREKVPKSGRPREVPVHPVTAKLLAAWRARGWRQLFGRAPGPDDLVVPNRAGSYVTDLNVTENLRRDLEVLGLRHRRFHDTKRTFVSLAREGGATPLLRWISHGPTQREMLDTYSSPDWRSLCREVARVKVTVSTRKLVQADATKTATPRGGAKMKAAISANLAKCPGRDSNSARKGQVPKHLSVVPRPSLAATGTDGLPAGGRRSKPTTHRSPPPFRGGMRIEEG